MNISWPRRILANALILRHRTPLILALLASIAGTPRGPAAAAEGSGHLNGIWKLVANDGAEWAIFEIKRADAKPIVAMIDGPKFYRNLQIYVARSPEALVILLSDEQSDMTFKGRLTEAGTDGRIVGALQVRMSGRAWTSGARLEKTTANKVAEPKDTPEKSGAAATVSALLEMRKATAEFLDDRYRPLELTTAVAAAAGVPLDAPTTARVWAVSRLVDAAKRSGKADVAAEAELAKLKVLIAEERRPATGPLVVEPFAGRRASDGDRVLLVELFTGAQCGPCVAADMAFDALSTAYKPADLITLQYHLHIPGPDPLTSPDSISRQRYYGVRSTPSTYFNGRALAGGGGPAADSRRKFNQYRHVIDELLKGKKAARIELAARRTGDEVHITASASGHERAGALPTLPRLRLALVEESVPYTGRNRLPSHHFVVRAMPGGAEGRPFEGGKARFEETVSLTKIRSLQDAYLQEYPRLPESRGAFSGTLPPVALEKLRVVAFVQDDSDRMVLDAMVVSLD